MQEQRRADALALAWYARATHRDALPVCGACRPATTGNHRRDAKRQPKLTKQADPRAIERRYVRQLKRRATEIDKLTREAIAAPLAKLFAGIEKRAAKEDGVRRDSLASDLADVLRVIARIGAAVSTSPLDPNAIKKTGAATAGFSARAVSRQLATVIGIDVAATAGQTAELLTAWAAENVKLIKSMEARYFADIARVVEDAVAKGRSTATLSKDLRERLRVSKSRADLIARDQIGTLNANVTEARQTSLGIEEYTWSDSGDDKVRPLHEELDDTVRRWDTPHPTEGHPGEAIQCRCSAIPKIPIQAG